MIIYCTTNLINGRKYIGQDFHNDPKYLGSGKLLKNAIKKNGSENFKKQTLQECVSIEDLNESEIYWIDYFGAVKSKLFYNIATGGNHIWKGQKLTEEHKRKLSMANKGQKHSDYQRELQSKRLKGRSPWNKGMVTSDEVKIKISEANKGRTPPNKGVPMSDEQKAGLSAFMKGKPSFFLGKKHSEESKLKLSASKLGKPSHRKGVKLPEEQKQKHSEFMKGRIPWNKGVKRSEEEKLKQSESMKGRIPWNKGRKIDKNSEEYLNMSKTFFKKKSNINEKQDVIR